MNGWIVLRTWHHLAPPSITKYAAEVKSATTAASLAAADLAAARSEVRAANAEADRISAQLVARSGSAQTVLEGGFW